MLLGWALSRLYWPLFESEGQALTNFVGGMLCWLTCGAIFVSAVLFIHSTYEGKGPLRGWRIFAVAGGAVIALATAFVVLSLYEHDRLVAAAVRAHGLLRQPDAQRASARARVGIRQAHQLAFAESKRLDTIGPATRVYVTNDAYFFPLDVPRKAFQEQKKVGWIVSAADGQVTEAIDDDTRYPTELGIEEADWPK